MSSVPINKGAPDLMEYGERMVSVKGTTQFWSTEPFNQDRERRFNGGNFCATRARNGIMTPITNKAKFCRPCSDEERNLRRDQVRRLLKRAKEKRG